jgi:tRNA pseudouridine38-40 synthase
MLDVGGDDSTPTQFQDILAARNRAAAGPTTAPARGLFLHSVEYDERRMTRH